MPPSLHRVLTRYFALAYWVLVVYASLHPFRGWQFRGPPALAFLGADWPRYWTAFDLTVNVAVYAPLGFLLALALRPLLRPWPAATVAVLLAGGTSLAIEIAQNWLPARVPSNVDLACNALGGLLGALAAQRAGERWLERLSALEHRILRPAPHASLGLTLVGLWLVAQISPETGFATTGDVRQLIREFFPGFTPIDYDPAQLLHFEAAAVAAQVLAVGLLLRGLLRDRGSLVPAVLLFFCVAAAIRALTASVLLSPPAAFDWLTPGSTHGLVVGGVLLLPLMLVPRAWLVPLAAAALAASCLAVNLMPADPYRLHDLALWRQGHFLNFNGLTRWLGLLWPLLAAGYLALARRQP